MYLVYYFVNKLQETIHQSTFLKIKKRRIKRREKEKKEKEKREENRKNKGGKGRKSILKDEET